MRCKRQWLQICRNTENVSCAVSMIAALTVFAEAAGPDSNWHDTTHFACVVTCEVTAVEQILPAIPFPFIKATLQN